MEATPDAIDVPFCDLCNTSVPLQDLEQGRARRHLGKTIGACCLPALAATAAPAPGTVSSQGTDGTRLQAPEPVGGGVAAPAAAAVHHDARLLPVGITVLAALAATAIFLDYRFAEVDSRNEQALAQIADDQKALGDVVQGISLAMDSVVRRKDLDAASERIELLNGAQTRIGDQLRALTDQTAMALSGLQQKIEDLQRSRPDHGPALLELRQALQQQAVTLAELKAMPRSQPQPLLEAPPPAPVTPGLPPLLAHQVQRLKDPDPATRFEAVDELLRSKDVAVLEHLLPMAKDEDTFVRRLTVEGLKDFRQPVVVDALLVALADPVETVRDTAWRSLKDLTGQKLPFDAAASRDQRARMQQRWQEWWDRNRAAFGS